MAGKIWREKPVAGGNFAKVVMTCLFFFATARAVAFAVANVATIVSRGTAVAKYISYGVLLWLRAFATPLTATANLPSHSRSYWLFATANTLLLHQFAMANIIIFCSVRFKHS